MNLTPEEARDAEIRLLAAVRGNWKNMAAGPDKEAVDNFAFELAEKMSVVLPDVDQDVMGRVLLVCGSVLLDEVGVHGRRLSAEALGQLTSMMGERLLR